MLSYHGQKGGYHQQPGRKLTLKLGWFKSSKGFLRNSPQVHESNAEKIRVLASQPGIPSEATDDDR